MGNKTFTYKAFISYTSRDIRFAEKLEMWLIDISNHMDPEKKYLFFRDSSYADAGEYVEEKLKQALEESEWLILICSPFVNDYKAGKKNWVDFECSYYSNNLGRKNNIVGIISNTAPLDRDIISFFLNA